MKKYISSSIVLNLIFIHSAALAQTPGTDDFSPGGRQRFWQKMNLSPQQKEDLRRLRGGTPQMKVMFWKAAAERSKLNEMMRDDSMSDKEVMAQTEELNRAVADFNTQRVKRLLELRKILSAEQRLMVRERIHKFFSERPAAGSGGTSGGGFWSRFRKRGIFDAKEKDKTGF